MRFRASYRISVKCRGTPPRYGVVGIKSASGRGGGSGTLRTAIGRCPPREWPLLPGRGRRPQRSVPSNTAVEYGGVSEPGHWRATSEPARERAAAGLVPDRREHADAAVSPVGHVNFAGGVDAIPQLPRSTSTLRAFPLHSRSRARWNKKADPAREEGGEAGALLVGTDVGDFTLDEIGTTSLLL